MASEYDWGGWDYGDPHTVVLGTKRGKGPRSVGFVWKGEAASAAQARSRAMASAKRAWAIMLATRGKAKAPMPYVVREQSRRENERLYEEVHIGRHAVDAILQAEDHPRRPKLDPQSVYDAGVAAVRCSYQRELQREHVEDFIVALMPEIGICEVDREGSWNIACDMYSDYGDDGETEVIGGDLRPAMLAASIALAILAGRDWYLEPIEHSTSATLRIAKQPWSREPHQERVAKVTSFLQSVGLKAEAMAFEKAYP